MNTIKRILIGAFIGVLATVLLLTLGDGAHDHVASPILVLPLMILVVLPAMALAVLGINVPDSGLWVYGFYCIWNGTVFGLISSLTLLFWKSSDYPKTSKRELKAGSTGNDPKTPGLDP